MPLSPNMNLPIPVPSQTGGPQYALDEQSCFQQIDSHNHTPGQGIAIPLNALNINQNLDMSALSVTNLKSISFLNQAISPGSSSLYMLGNDLYWTDGSGAFNVQITSGNAVAVSGAIGFSGLPSGTASAAYLSLTGTFRFQSATNTGATLDVGPIKLRNTTVSSNAVTLTPPNPLPSNYSLTFPSALPASNKILQVDPSGNILDSLDVDNSTLEINGTNLRVKALGIGTSQLADGSVTSIKLDPAALTIAPANRTPTTTYSIGFNSQTPTYPARWNAVGPDGALNIQSITSFAYTPSRVNVNLLSSMSKSAYGGSYLYWSNWNSGGPGPGGAGYKPQCYFRVYFQNANITTDLLIVPGGTEISNTNIVTITDNAPGNIKVDFYYYNVGNWVYTIMLTANLSLKIVELN